MSDQSQSAHYCTGCGEMHGGEHRESPEVAIARINREADVRIAEIQRGQFQQTELEAETEVAVAEIEAAAVVDEATVKAEVLDEILTPPEPEPDPVVVVADETDPAPAEEPPSAEPPETPEPPAAEKRGNPWW